MKKNSLFFTLLLTVSYTQAMKLIQKQQQLVFTEQDINNPWINPWINLLPREIRCLTIKHLFPEIEQTDLDILSDLHKGQIHIAYKKSSEYAQLYPMIDINNASPRITQQFVDNPSQTNENTIPICAYIRLTKNQCHSLSRINKQQISLLLNNPIGNAFDIAINQKLSITISKKDYEVLKQLLQTHKTLCKKIILSILSIQKESSFYDIIKCGQQQKNLTQLVQKDWHPLHSIAITAQAFMGTVAGGYTYSFLTTCGMTASKFLGSSLLFGSPVIWILCALLLKTHSTLQSHYASQNTIEYNNDTENNINRATE